MTSFAFKYVSRIPPVGSLADFCSTMIGQVTPLGMANVGWRFYILFIVRKAGRPLFSYNVPAILTRNLHIGHEY
jgi:hypothetical protein